MGLSKTFLLVVAVLVTGCTGLDRRAPTEAASESALACAGVAGAKRWARTELYFGLSRPDGSLISEDEFQRFLDSEVTPRFRDGFSVLAGRGQFLSETGALVKESSRVVVLFYPFAGRTSAAVDEIRRAYRSQYQQESVLRVDAAECVAF